MSARDRHRAELERVDWLRHDRNVDDLQERLGRLDRGECVVCGRAAPAGRLTCSPACLADERRERFSL